MMQKFEFKETEIKGLYEITPFNVDDIRGCFTKDYSKEVLAYLFHLAISNAIVENVSYICKEYDVKQIALSGGTFINRILLREVMTGLREKGLEVYTNEKVPCGDGGIALGQMYLMTFEE